MNRKQRRAQVAERRGNTIILDRREAHAFDGFCAFCQTLGELRPFGPNNESICFDCAMKDEATTSRKFTEYLENLQ